MTEHEKEHGHHAEENQKTHETHHRGTHGMNKFQKFVGTAIVLQIIIMIFISYQISGLVTLEVEDDTDVKVEDPKPPEKQPTPQPSPPTPTVNAEDLIDDDAIKGDKDAPVTIVEWSDFECSFCARFYSQTLSKIQEEYIDTGKVKFVYRDFPLSFHPNAQKAAEAAECAGEQGNYYEMHDLLFEKGVKGGVDSYKQFASDIGLDTDEFNDCLDSGKMASEVKADMDAGAAAGVRGTPGFVINGQAVSGAQPFENFKQIIDAELAK
ncbi:DsbA family protein [Nanoarchaeota archaeon]